MRQVLRADAMRRISFIVILLTFPIAAQQTDPVIAELRETISKIVDTQTLEAKERLDWKARKAEMQALLELHGKELKLLGEELEKSGDSAPGHAGSMDSLEAEITSLKESRRLASETIARNVPRAISLAKRFPAPLLSEAEPEISSLSTWKKSDEPRDTLRSVLSLVAKAEQFNRRFIRSSEIRDNHQVEVIYLGLARAYYAGKNKTAGTGTPGTDGWVWKSQPALHSSISSAIDTFDKKVPPSMIELPLEID